MKILLAVDGSEYTRKMLDYVAANQALFDAGHTYVVLNAQPELPPHVRSSLGSTSVKDYHQDEAAKVLQPALAALSARGLTAQSEWKAGQAGETIAQYAKDGGFDMVIMGTHGHGSLARLVMGSVTTEVLANCGVPVLLIR
ncbi:universal stress protein [Ramlibacter terrae]|uniref:Universal stress protein n=1 Tax=Ramlibacter terrae TaxID=2732511 RepID=A0ABX6NZQ4_9BURK|nr:universal stress protein [Ramlibacter terrae]